MNDAGKKFLEDWTRDIETLQTLRNLTQTTLLLKCERIFQFIETHQKKFTESHFPQKTFCVMPKPFDKILYSAGEFYHSFDDTLALPLPAACADELLSDEKFIQALAEHVG